MPDTCRNGHGYAERPAAASVGPSRWQLEKRSVTGPKPRRRGTADRGGEQARPDIRVPAKQGVVAGQHRVPIGVVNAPLQPACFRVDNLFARVTDREELDRPAQPRQLHHLPQNERFGCQWEARDDVGERRVRRFMDGTSSVVQTGYRVGTGRRRSRPTSSGRRHDGAWPRQLTPDRRRRNGVPSRLPRPGVRRRAAAPASPDRRAPPNCHRSW